MLTADSVADRKIFNINIRLTLNNREVPLSLKALELHVPEISAPIIFDDIDGVYKTKGIIQIKALAEGEFTVGEKKEVAFLLCAGCHNIRQSANGCRRALPVVFTLCHKLGMSILLTIKRNDYERSFAFLRLSALYCSVVRQLPVHSPKL